MYVRQLVNKYIVWKSALYFICTCCELTCREKEILHLLVAVNGCEISE